MAVVGNNRRFFFSAAADFAHEDDLLSLGIGFEQRHVWQPPFGDYDDPEFKAAAASPGGARS